MGLLDTFKPKKTAKATLTQGKKKASAAVKKQQAKTSTKAVTTAKNAVKSTTKRAATAVGKSMASTGKAASTQKKTQSTAYDQAKLRQPQKRSTISTDIKNQTKVKNQKPSVVSGPVQESRDNRDERMRQSWSQRHPENQVQREQRNEKLRPKSYVPSKGMAIPNKGQSAYDAEIEEFTRNYVQAGKLNPNERAGIAQGPMKDKGPIDLSTARDYDTMLSGGTVPGKYIPDENKVGALEYNIRMMGQDTLSKPYAEEIFKNASPSEQAQLVKAARETVGFSEQTDRWAKEADKARANASAEEQGRFDDVITGTRRDQYGHVVNSREKLQDYIYRTSTDKYNSAVKQQQFVDQWAKEHGTTAEDYLRSRFNTGAGGFVQSVWDGLFLPAESVKDYDRPGYYLGGFKAPHEGISKDKNILQNSWQWYTNLTSDAITMALLPYKAIYKNTAERSDNFRQNTQNLYDLAMKWTGQDERIVRQEALRRLNESMGKDQNPATQFVGDALEATVQMVPGMALSVVDPAVGMALFAESAGGMYARSALDNGASLEEALTYGTMCGALEGAVEKIFPFMGTYGRSFSGGMLAKMLGGRTTRGKVLFDSVVRDLSSNAFRQSMRGRILIGLGESLGEFTEEALMEVIEPFVRKSTYDAMADYASLEEIGMAGLLGAAIGVGLHAPSIGAATTGTLAKSVYISNQKLFAKAEYEDAVTRATNMADMGIISKELAERSIKEAKAIYDRNMAELAGVSGTGSLLDEERQGGEYKTSSNLEHLYSNRQEANAATVEPGTSAYFMEDGEVKRITHSEAGVKSEDAVLTNSEKTAYAEKAERLKTAKNNTERTGVQANVRQDVIDQAAEMARVYNRNVEFYRDEEAAKRYDDRGRFDPKTETIYVNAATDKPLQTIVSHEMVHAMRNTNAFKELLREIKTYYKDSYDADVNDIRRMYSERDENGNVIEPSEGIIQEEVVAHFVEKKLLTDEAWVNTFLTNSRTDKILRGINTLLQRGLGGKEARFLASVRSKWLNALEEERGEQTAPRAEAVAAAKGESGVRYAKGEKRDPNPFIYEMHRAKRMEELGYSEKDIIEATGWYKRKNKKDKKPAYIWAVRDRLSPDEKYDFRKSFAQQIEDYLKGKFHATDTFLVGDTPELLQKIGLDDLPVTLGIYHVLTAINYHDGHSFTIDEIKKLPEAIEKPLAVIRSTSENHKNDSVVMIVKLGEQARDVIPIRIGGNGKLNGESIICNSISTFFTHGNLNKVLDKAVNAFKDGENSIYFFDTERLKNEAGYQLERTGSHTSGTLQKGGFINNIIGDYWENVKRAEENRSAKGSRDAEYLAAVERGDMETAQRLVEEAAREAGYTVEAYHGTSRGDRVGNVFLPERATSGPMAFFTDNREIAKNYAKDKADTSLAYDSDYDTYESQFRFHNKSRSIDGKLHNAWGYVPLEDRAAIRRKAGQLRFDWDGEDDRALILDERNKEGTGGFQYHLKWARNNPILALEEEWLNSGNLFNEEERFLDVIKMVGITDALKRVGLEVEYKDPNYREEKVYDTFLKIEKPFDATKKVTEAFVKRFENWYAKQNHAKYERDSSNADMWDKTNVSAELFAERMRYDIENGTTHAWTSIPDSMTDYLKHLKYDGIKDTGGKYTGEQHTVWIPFSSEQIKSADPVTRDKEGKVIPLSERFNTENDDIRYAKGDRDSEYLAAVKAERWWQVRDMVNERAYEVYSREIDDALSNISSLNEKQLEDCVTKLGFLNSLATKGRRYLTEGQREYNSRIYTVKEKALLDLAKAWKDRGLDVSYHYGVVYFRKRNGIQISFHTGTDPIFERGLNGEMKRLLGESNTYWDGVQNAFAYDDYDEYRQVIEDKNRLYKKAKEIEKAQADYRHNTLYSYLSKYRRAEKYGIDLDREKRDWDWSGISFNTSEEIYLKAFGTTYDMLMYQMRKDAKKAIEEIDPRYSYDPLNYEILERHPKDYKLTDLVTYDDEGKVIPLSERFNPEENDIRYAKGYDFTKSFAQQVDEIDKIPEDDNLLIGETPEIYIKIGLNKLPLIIRKKHPILDALRKDAPSHHKYSKPEIKDLPKALKNPLAVIQSETEEGTSVVVFINLGRGKNKEIAAVRIDGKGRINEKEIHANIVKTVFDKSNLEDLFARAIANHQLEGKGLYYLDPDFAKNKASNLLQRSRVQFPDSLRSGGLINSIRDESSPVKRKFKEITKTKQFKRWFGDSVAAKGKYDPIFVYYPSKVPNPATADPKRELVSNEALAKKLAGKDGAAIPVYASIQRSARSANIIDAKGASSDRMPIPKQMKEAYPDVSTVSVDMIRRWEDAKDYDGVKITNVKVDDMLTDMYIFNESGQVKRPDGIGLYDRSIEEIRYAKGDKRRLDPGVAEMNYLVGDTVEVNGQRGKVEERYYDDGDIRYVVLFDDGSRKDVLPDELTTNVTPSFHFDELPEEEQEAFEEPPNDYDFYDDDIFYEDDDGDVLYEEDRGIRMGNIVTSEDSPKTVKKRKKASEKRKKFEKPKKKDSKSILDDELIKEFLATESDGFFDTGENYDLATYLTGDGVTYSKDYARNFDAASRGNQSLRGWLQDLFVRPLEKGKRDYANAVDRKLNQMRTKMKELGIKKGSQESAAVQWYGEKFYTDEYGVQHDYTLEDLKKEFPEKWEDIKEAAEWFRKVYDDYLVQINTARAKIYPDPVGDVTEKVNDYQDKVNYYEQRIDETRAEIREIERALDAKRQDYASKKDGTKVKEKLERSIRYNERRIEKRNAQIEEDILRKQKYKNLLERYQRDLNSGDVTRNKRIVPRKDYFHHFLELQQGLGNIFSLSRSGADIDPHLEGTSEFTQPKSKFAKITLHRKNGRYTPDAIGGMIDYIQAGEYMINIDPVISLFRSHIKGIMDATVEERNANKLIKWLVNWTNDLAGKTNTIDRFMMDRIGRDRIAFIKRLNSRAKANAVVGNLNSAFAQFFNFPNVAGYVHNPIAYAQGFEDLVKFIARQKDARMLVRESGFLNERYLDDAIRQFDERIIDKPEKLAVWTLTVGDRYTTVLIWFTAYHDALKKNVDDPIEYADDITRRSVAGRGIGEIPLTQKSLMTQLFAPFQIEVNNAWQLYKEKVKGIAKNETKKEKAEAAYGFASVLVMNFLLNTVTDLLIHRRVVFDPLFVFFEWLGSLGDDDDDDDETKFDKFTQLLGREIGEVFSSMPFGSLIAYYAIENDYLREQLFGDNDPTRYGVGNAALKPLASLLADVLQGKDISDDVLTVLMTYLPPVGGKQIERFLTGLKMEGYLPDIKFSLKEGFSAEKHPAASYNAKGELQFPVEDFKSNPLQALVGLVFGKYATDAGQKYLGKDYDQSWWRNILGWNNIKPGSAMNERATSVFNALVAEGSDRFAIFDVLNELKGDKKISVKRDILLNSGLTDGEMAAILLNVITDKDRVESETNKLNSIIGTGAFNVSDYLKIKNIQSRINADKNMSAEDKALLFVEMLQGEGYSDSDVGIITEVLKFWRSIPANTKRYDTLTTYGLDSDTAAKVTKAINQLTPLEGASEVSEMQKFEAIIGLGLDDETETTALRTAFSDEKSYAKYVLVHNNGVSPQLYADFKKALKDANDNNPDESKRNTSYDKEEKQTALDSLSGATTAQKAALWQIADNALSKTDHDAAWKGARNPYDTSVGTTVADGYTSTLESVQSMKTDTAELSTERAERDKYNHLKPIAAKAAALGKKLVKNLTKTETSTTEETKDDSAYGQPITEFTRVSSPYGYNVDSVHAGRLHAGMDLAAPLGTPAMAVNGGKVIQASDKGNGYGNCVIYEDADGVQWLYGHLDTINVSVGDTITKGQKVGSIDSTGSSTGNHLHFEARVNGSPVNPQSLIDITGGGLVTADTGVKYSGGGGGGGRKSGSKKSGGSSGGKKGKATTQAAYTPTYAPTTTRSSGSSGSSSGGSSGKSSSKATRTPAARRTQTSVAKGIMLPTAREIDSARRTSTPTVARNGGKSASRGIVLPTAAEVASAAAGARIGYGSGTSSIRRTNRSRGSFWHENVLG